MKHCLRGMQVVHMRTQYSGKGTAESIMHIISEAINEHPDLGEMNVHCLQAVERDQAAVEVLSTMRQPPLCIMKCMSSRLPPALKIQFDLLRPTADATIKERTSAYDSMRQLVMAEGALDPNGMAKCVVHNRECPIFSWRLPGASGQTATGGDIDPTSGSIGGPWRIMAAGTTCKDWSTRNRDRLGLAGPSAEAFWVWMSEIRQTLPHLVVHEITTVAPMSSLLEEALGDRYLVLSCKRICPSDLGYPVTRPRQVTVCILKSEVLYHGSWGEFFSIFRRQSVMLARDFALDEAGAILQMRERAALQKNFFSNGAAVKLTDCLPAGQMNILQKYQDRRVIPAGMPLIYDIMQHPAFCPAPGTHCPTLTCGSLLVLDDGVREAGPRLLSGTECLHMLGEPLFGDGGSLQISRQTLARLGDAKKRNLAGNAWHLPTLGIVMLYVLANCERIRSSGEGRLEFEGESQESTH